MSPWKAKKKERFEAAVEANRNQPQVVSRSEIMGVIRKTVSDIMTHQMIDFERKLAILVNANTEKLGEQIYCLQTSTCRHIDNLEANIRNLQMYACDRLESKETGRVHIIVQDTTQRNQEDSKEPLSDESLESEIQATVKNQEFLKANTGVATDAHAYEQRSRNQSTTSRCQDHRKPIYSETNDVFTPNTSYQERPKFLDSQLMMNRSSKDFSQQTSIDSHVVNLNLSPTSRQDHCKPIYSETTDAFPSKPFQERPQSVVHSQMKARATEDSTEQASFDSQTMNRSAASREDRCKSICLETMDVATPKPSQDQPKFFTSQVKDRATGDFTQQTSIDSQIVNQSQTPRQDRCKPIYSETADVFTYETFQEHRPQMIDSQLMTRASKDFSQQTSVDSKIVNLSPTYREDRCKPIYSETTRTYRGRPKITNSQLETLVTKDFTQQTYNDSQIVNQSQTLRQDRSAPIHSEKVDVFTHKTFQEHRPQIVDSHPPQDFSQQTSVDSQTVNLSPTSRHDRCEPIYSETTDAFTHKIFKEPPQNINSQLKTPATEDFAQQTAMDSQALSNQSPTSRQDRCKPIFSETTDVGLSKTFQGRPQIIPLKSRATEDSALQQPLIIYDQNIVNHQNQSQTSRQNRCKPIYSESTAESRAPKTSQERPKIINSQLMRDFTQQTILDSQILRSVSTDHAVPTVVHSQSKDRTTKDFTQQTSIDPQNMTPRVTNGVHAVPVVIHSQSNAFVKSYAAKQTTVDSSQMVQRVTKGHASSTVVHSHYKTRNIATEKSQSLCIDNFYI